MVVHNNINLMSPIRLDFNDEALGNEEKELGYNLRNNNANDGLRKPFKEALKSPFTRRIIEFSAPKHKMPTNVKIYDGSTDLDDHISRLQDQQTPKIGMCRIAYAGQNSYA
ncbi:hypothetical protein Tco_0330986 [Tanacetum coccineum]